MNASNLNGHKDADGTKYSVSGTQTRIQSPTGSVSYRNTTAVLKDKNN